ncbi:MAG: hypothetical protein RI894_1052 [Bacteroidota bacterium]|jgi:nucleoside-diphosphate-sugar epimerase
MTNKLVIVTGANGFVGSHLVDRLLQRGYSVRCIVRKSSNLQWLTGKSVDFVYAGLDDVRTLQTAFAQAELIFHIAGVVKSSNYDGFIAGNVTTTQCVLQAASSTNTLKHLIITSSLAAHGPNPIGKPSEEASSPQPISEYGRSKHAQEQLVASYNDRLPVTIIRPPAVYGERDTEVLLFFKTVQKGVFPSMIKEQTLSMVHVSDLVTGMIQAAESEKAIGQTYFLSSQPAEYSQSFVAKTIAKGLNKRFIHLRLPYFIIYLAAAVSEFLAFFTKKTPALNLKKLDELKQDSWACSSAKATADFGYQPQISLEKGVAQTIEWYQKQGWL